MWKQESKELVELFKEEYQSEFDGFQDRWAQLENEERQTILIMTMESLHDNENGEMALLHNVFPDLFVLIEQHELILPFIQQMYVNPRYCSKDLFDLDEMKEMIEQETDRSTALYCITSLLFARMCIATKFCLHILIMTNAIDF